MQRKTFIQSIPFFWFLPDIANMKINSTGRKMYINAAGRPGTVKINNSEPEEPEPPEDGPQWDCFLRFSLITSQLELVNDGKGIQQITGGTNAFTKERFCWGFNPIEHGDRLIWKINSNPTYSAYVYLNEESYGWSNSNSEYAANAQIGFGGQARIALRDRNSGGAILGTYTSIAADDLCAFLYNANGTISLQKWVTGAWSTIATSTYTASGSLYGGIKTFRPGSGVNEIYVNTAEFHEFPTTLTAQKGAVLGDSTFDYCGTDVMPLDTQFWTVQERLAGYELVVLADGGDTIPQQKTVWNAYADQGTLDFVIIQLGLNNLYYLEGQSDATDIAQLQDLVDTIAADVPGIKIIISTMVPAKGRWYDIIWPSDAARAANAQASWTAINAAVRGEGGSPITGVDARVSSHTTELDDGTGYMKDEYSLIDAGTGEPDEIHTNGLGREVNIGHEHLHEYTALRAALKTLDIIS